MFDYPPLFYNLLDGEHLSFVQIPTLQVQKHFFFMFLES